MATPAIIEKMQKIPTKTRAIAFFSVVGVILVLFIWQVHIPKTNEIKKLDSDIAVVNTKIRENEAKIKRLDDLRAEVKALQERLVVMQQQLPMETEVSGLLRQIQGLVNKSGLSLKLWKPDKRKVHSSGLYEEIPINLELTGGYHNVALFFDSVSKLTRIVNMLNVRMKNAKVGKSGLMEITVECTAMTFAATEKKVEAPQAATAAKKVN
ncbi:MAG: type 4a pilus biogenesis protein PilO [Nitrospiraceae bacterium]|nr:type 4a pilus biogenesis protein PilO [Nitrospiraceae bacterium]